MYIHKGCKASNLGDDSNIANGLIVAVQLYGNPS